MSCNGEHRQLMHLERLNVLQAKVLERREGRWELPEKGGKMLFYGKDLMYRIFFTMIRSL